MGYPYFPIFKPQVSNIYLPVPAGFSAVCMGMIDTIKCSISSLYYTIVSRTGNRLAGTQNWIVRILHKWSHR